VDNSADFVWENCPFGHFRFATSDRINLALLDLNPNSGPGSERSGNGFEILERPERSIRFHRE
jgi:hypothetical protein